MVMASGNGPGGITITKPVTKALRATLTIVEQIEKSARLRRILHETSALKQEAKTAAKRIKTQIEDLEREGWLITEQLDTNSQVRDVPCEELLDLDRNECIVTRCDTREEIDRRGLKDEERAELKKLRQKTLPGIAAAPDPSKETAAAAPADEGKKKRAKKGDKVETTVTVTGPDGVERQAVTSAGVKALATADTSPMVIVGIPLSQWLALPTDARSRLQANIAHCGIESGAGALSWSERDGFVEAGPVRASAIHSLEELFQELGLETLTRDPNAPAPKVEGDAPPADASAPTHEGALDASDEDEPPPDPPEEFDAKADGAWDGSYPIPPDEVDAIAAAAARGTAEVDVDAPAWTIERRAKGDVWEPIEEGQQTDMAKRFDELLEQTPVEDGLRLKDDAGVVQRLSNGTKKPEAVVEPRTTSTSGAWRVEIRTPSGGEWKMLTETADKFTAAMAYEEHRTRLAPGLHIRIARPDGTTEQEESAPPKGTKPVKKPAAKKTKAKPAAKLEARAKVVKSCRVCGCTTNNACLEWVRGAEVPRSRPCHWVEADLCSACEGEVT